MKFSVNKRIYSLEKQRERVLINQHLKYLTQVKNIESLNFVFPFSQM